MGAVSSPRRTTAMATDRDIHDYEPPHASSPTAHIVDQLELHGLPSQPG